MPWYTLLMGVGLVGGAWVWARRFRARPEMIAVYAGAVLGALLGAKGAFVLAEWPWIRGSAEPWRLVLHGKTVLGALLGGYLGVEAGKKLVGYRAATGDLFAVLVPMGLVLGRLGCALHGCCVGVACEARWWMATDGSGQARWPASAVELVFNGLAAVVLAGLVRRGVGRGQLFHVYLMGYAAFRLVHEPMRATPKYAWGGSPYQVLAGVILVFATWRFMVRARLKARGHQPLSSSGLSSSSPGSQSLP